MTQIRVLRPGDEPALEAFLLPRIETSMFLLGNMRAAGLEDHGQHLQGTYVAAFDGDQIVGVVAHYWNENLILQAQAPVQFDALCHAAIEASGRKLMGLLGPAAQVQAVKDAFDLSEDAIQMDETENLYSLRLADLIVPEGLRSGRLTGRRIQPGDVEQVTEWLVAFSLEALAEEEGPQLWELVRSGVQRKQVQGLTWILHDRGNPVSTSAFNTRTAEVVQIGGVYTPPELRSRGYGRAVVAASLLDARAEGVHSSILFTGVENIAAQRSYGALGYQHIGDYRLLRMRESADA
ncbi:MAG: GNAT family N-acetyltransferase [Anaerolineae bacterium]|jgi:predicted GNAT family acetyltransferase